MKTTGAPTRDDAEWMCGKPAKLVRYCLDTDLLMDVPLPEGRTRIVQDTRYPRDLPRRLTLGFTRPRAPRFRRLRQNSSFCCSGVAGLLAVRAD